MVKHVWLRHRGFVHQIWTLYNEGNPELKKASAHLEPNPHQVGREWLNNEDASRGHAHGASDWYYLVL